MLYIKGGNIDQKSVVMLRGHRSDVLLTGQQRCCLNMQNLLTTIMF
jgi:hypothetical protein